MLRTGHRQDNTGLDSLPHRPAASARPDSVAISTVLSRWGSWSCQLLVFLILALMADVMELHVEARRKVGEVRFLLRCKQLLKVITEELLKLEPLKQSRPDTGAVVPLLQLPHIRLGTAREWSTRMLLLRTAQQYATR